MNREASILIRKYGKKSKQYKKLVTDYAKVQGYDIKQVIQVKEYSPLFYGGGRSKVLEKLIEGKTTILLVYSFQHLSHREEELYQFLKALQRANVMCYAVLESMYLHETRKFLLSPHY